MSERPIAVAVRYCCRPRHLRRTLTIAVVVGVITAVTATNQLDVILGGEATAVTVERRPAQRAILRPGARRSTAGCQDAVPGDAVNRPGASRVQAG